MTSVKDLINGREVERIYVGVGTIRVGKKITNRIYEHGNDWDLSKGFGTTTKNPVARLAEIEFGYQMREVYNDKVVNWTIQWGQIYDSLTICNNYQIYANIRFVDEESEEIISKVDLADLQNNIVLDLDDYYDFEDD